MLTESDIQYYHDQIHYARISNDNYWPSHIEDYRYFYQFSKFCNQYWLKHIKYQLRKKTIFDSLPLDIIQYISKFKYDIVIKELKVLEDEFSDYMESQSI